ncbi:MAG TPA: SUMF1/EgtB/PvdO family nonheme iron enzyme [Sedimentisphaerales bacterium]|nr:SUMF1/EgtB/PvdO family nonheme iron enzyme [Sedimentisphaerales bacterium]
MRNSLLLAAFCCTIAIASWCHAENVDNPDPVVSNVTASMRTDGSRLVDIHYNLSDADGDTRAVWVEISADSGLTWNLRAEAVSGDVGSEVQAGTQRHIVWDAAADLPDAEGCGFKARVHAADSLFLAPMALVPAGTFTCSTNVEVYLDAYYIDIFEVTNELYCRFLNAGGNDDHWHSSTESPPYEQQIIKHGTGNYSVADGKEQRPVRHVNWHDAVAFCDWRSAAEGLPAGTYRLPTEAQWEKAAGWDPVAGKLWTYAIQSDTIRCGTVNYYLCVGRTTDVGSYPYTSFYGCYDMSGNVWEWCADWYQSTYPSGTSDPTGPTSGSGKVLRGGGWYSLGSLCRVSYRYGSHPTNWSRSRDGFRCARTLE